MFTALVLLAALAQEPPAPAKSFTITARRFSFDVSPAPFVVAQGDNVTLTLQAADVEHGFILEQYAEDDHQLRPGQPVTIQFVASTAGSFGFFCTIVCGDGHPTMNGTFTVTAQNPTPTITSFTPTSGSANGGTNVAIAGTNFQNDAIVRFGALDAVTVNVFSSTSLVALTPASPEGSVPITVSNPGGGTATSQTPFTFLGPNAAITSITPSSGTTAGGTAVTIAGNSFREGARVTIGGRALTDVRVESGTRITGTTAAGPADFAGERAFDVVVQNPIGPAATLTGGFRYVVPALTISSLSPDTATTPGGATVTIRGAGFTTADAPTVQFGDRAATNVSVVDATTLTATLPPAAQAGKVALTLRNGQGTASVSEAFTYLVPQPRRRAVRP